MKTLTVRLPVNIAAEIAAESQLCKGSKSDMVRERLTQYKPSVSLNMADLIGDLIGSVKGLPADLSNNKKKYLPGLIRAKNTPTCP